MSTQKEVDRMLKLLREKIRDQGFTQLKVQEALGWGRTYISQLFRKQKSLRFDQILSIIQVVGIDAGEFFAEFYGLSRPENEGGFYYYSYPGPPGFTRPKPVPPMPAQVGADVEKLNELHKTVDAIKKVLLEKGLLQADEAGAAAKPKPPDD
jgi:hypothetical protein